MMKFWNDKNCLSNIKTHHITGFVLLLLISGVTGGMFWLQSTRLTSADSNTHPHITDRELKRLTGILRVNQTSLIVNQSATFNNDDPRHPTFENCLTPGKESPLPQLALCPDQKTVNIVFVLRSGGGGLFSELNNMLLFWMYFLTMSPNQQSTPDCIRHNGWKFGFAYDSQWEHRDIATFLMGISVEHPWINRLEFHRDPQWVKKNYHHLKAKSTWVVNQAVSASVNDKLSPGVWFDRGDTVFFHIRNVMMRATNTEELFRIKSCLLKRYWKPKRMVTRLVTAIKQCVLKNQTFLFLQYRSGDKWNGESRRIPLKYYWKQFERVRSRQAASDPVRQIFVMTDNRRIFKELEDKQSSKPEHQKYRIIGWQESIKILFTSDQCESHKQDLIQNFAFTQDKMTKYSPRVGYFHHGMDFTGSEEGRYYFTLELMALMELSKSSLSLICPMSSNVCRFMKNLYPHNYQTDLDDWKMGVPGDIVKEWNPLKK